MTEVTITLIAQSARCQQGWCKVKVDLNKYISEERKQEIIEEEYRLAVRERIQDKERLKIILENAVYSWIGDECESVIKDYKNIVKEKTKKLIESENFSFYIFSEDCRGKEPLGKKYLIEAINDNKELFDQKVKQAIKETCFKEKVFTKLETMGENLIDMIYQISEVGKSMQTKESE